MAVFSVKPYAFLFVLLNQYVSIDIGISPKIISFLVNKNMRKLKLSWALYKILKISLPFFKMIRGAQTVLKDLLKGNWIKIWNQMKKWSLRKKARLRYEVSLGFKKLMKATNIL